MKTSRPSLRSDVFTLAAERIDKYDTNYACNAIRQVCAFDNVYGFQIKPEPYLLFFQKVLMPDYVNPLDGWYGPSEERDSRIYGLLLCAELVKRGHR